MLMILSLLMEGRLDTTPGNLADSLEALVKRLKQSWQRLNTTKVESLWLCEGNSELGMCKSICPDRNSDESNRMNLGAQFNAK